MVTVVVVYVTPVAAGIIAIPFFLQTYVGVLPPLVGVAVNVMLAPAQIVVEGVAIVTLGVNTGFTTIVIAVLVAVPGAKTQPELLTIRTVIASPFTKVVLVNVVAVVLAAPWLVAPMNHSYVGAAPPFPGLAVKVTLVPAQIAPAGAAVMLTAAVTVVCTVITIGVEVAVNGLAHVAVLVITTS